LAEVKVYVQKSAGSSPWVDITLKPIVSMSLQTSARLPAIPGI